jgi:integrase/recombinase XerC
MSAATVVPLSVLSKSTANPRPEDMFGLFLSGRSARTARAYERDLRDFASAMSVPSPCSALAHLLGGEAGAANKLALAYKAQMLARNLAPATINRRLATLGSAAGLARTFGVVSWSLSVERMKVRALRDTRGPGVNNVRKLIDAMAARTDAMTRRDLAIVRMLFDLGLRRSEVVTLDIEHLNLEASRVAVLAKGRVERELMTLPPETTSAIRSWIEVRGQHPGALFHNLDRAHKNRCRLSDRSVARAVKRAGKLVGVVALRPHGLRHAAITHALDLTSGDVRSVQKFSRHADPKTLLRYDDNREDLAGRVAKMIAASA